MNEWTRKIIRKTRLGTVKRIIQAKPVSEHFKLKGAIITNTDQFEVRDGHLYSTGKDPKIFIRFHHPVKEISVEMNIKTEYIEDKIELFYSDITKPCVDFSYNECYKIGKTNGKKSFQNILFPEPVKYIRVDIGEHEGPINVDTCKIFAKSSKYAKDYNEYNEILEEIPNAKKENIIIVTHALNETGAPLLAYNITKQFQEKKYDVVVIAISDGYLEEKFQDLNVPLLSLHQSLLSRELHNPKIFEGIVKQLSKKGYNQILTNTIISGITVPIFKKYNFNIISLIHEMKMSITLYDMKQGGRDISMYSDKIIFPDKTVEQEFLEIFHADRKKSIIRPQGLYQLKEEIRKDYNKVYRKYNLPSNAKIIVGSGTADLRKGIDLFLNAAQSLVKLEGKNEEYHFIWAGKILNEEIDNWYTLQLEKCNLKERFHNIGFIKDKAEYQNLIACSDAFWLTSREDPFPSVMIESLEYETPVLAFNKSGGAGTLLADDRGVLIDRFDIEKLAIETHKLVHDSKRCQEMLEKAQKYITKNLQFKDYIHDLEKIFTNVEKEEKFSYTEVSVIVPNYNYEQYLPVRLRSIINQTVKPKEIILLDDVSTDHSIEVAEPILKEAKKKYKIDYKIIKNESNNGCFNQWLKGISLAKYPYIWIAEADDYAKENFLETLMPNFEDKEVVLSYSKSQVIDETCKVSNYKYTDYTDDLSKTKWQKSFKEDGTIQIKKYFSRKNIIPNASSAVIRKSATIGLETVLKDYQAIGDWIAYIYILSHGKIAYAKEALNGHRRHSKSIIAKKEKSIKFLEEIIRIKKYVVENFDLTDEELNNMILSIQGIEDNYDKIMKNSKLKELWEDFQKQVSQKRKKHNLLIVVPDLNTGGGQTVAIRLANSMTKFYNVFIINTRESLETEYMKGTIYDKVTLLKHDDNIEKLRGFDKLLNFRGIISLVWWSDKLTYYAFGESDIPWIISMHGCYEMLLHNPDVDEYFEKNVEKMLNRANKIVYIYFFSCFFYILFYKMYFWVLTYYIFYSCY